MLCWLRSRRESLFHINGFLTFKKDRPKLKRGGVRLCERMFVDQFISWKDLSRDNCLIKFIFADNCKLFFCRILCCVDWARNLAYTEWAVKNKTTLNTSKTKETVFHRLYASKYSPNVLCDVERAISVKLSGMFWLIHLVRLNMFSRLLQLSLIHIWRCRRSYACRSRWSPYH